MKHRTGLTLIELLAVLAIVAALGAVIVPRIAGRDQQAKAGACHLNQGEIELQCQLWRRATGAFPPADLSGIGTSTAYFPSGLPTCPVDGSSYTINTSTGRVVGHNH